ncbi:MAG: phosphate signaling complex protein PhoU [Phycisphaerae bacterium]
MPRHLQREIEKLKKHILALGAVVEESFQKAVRAIKDKDVDLANKIISDDDEIDHTEVDIEEECLKILALYQPVATDLRFIVAALKINSDLERIGDLAVNIAERVSFLATQEKVTFPFDFDDMVQKTQSMLKRSLDALVNLDAGLAREVCAADDDVDAINRQMYIQVQQGIRAHPDQIEPLIHFLSISRHLERIADHTTNIAEDVIYMIEGEIVRHRTEDYRTK